MNDKYFKIKIDKTPYQKVLFDINKQDNIKKILIRSNNWLGDSAMLLPIVSYLKKNINPDISIDILCYDELVSFWSCYDFINEILSFSSRRVDKTTKKNIKDNNYDLAIVFPNSFGSAFDLYILKLKIMGRETSYLRKQILKYPIPKSTSINHQINEYIDFILALGLNIDTKQILELPKADFELSDDEIKFLEINPFYNDYLVLAVGAKYGAAKQWPTHFFCEIANYWESLGKKVILVGANSDEELGNKIMNYCPNILNLIGKTEIKELMYILNKSSCIVSNDSGVMHLASIIGKFGIAIFGSTSPQKTGPIGNNWIVLRKNDLTCSPCFKRECYLKIKKYVCLSEIDSKDVIEVIKGNTNKYIQTS